MSTNTDADPIDDAHHDVHTHSLITDSVRGKSGGQCGINMITVHENEQDANKYYPTRLSAVFGANAFLPCMIHTDKPKHELLDLFVAAT